MALKLRAACCCLQSSSNANPHGGFNEADCSPRSLNMDLVVRTPVCPYPAKRSSGVHSDFPWRQGRQPGVAIARLGAPVFMIGRVGSDAFGDELIAAAARDGVDTRGSLGTRRRPPVWR